jgi:hypothetical protein
MFWTRGALVLPVAETWALVPQVEYRDQHSKEAEGAAQYRQVDLLRRAFVGGKLSKNEGGVTVNTPQGALAIRGGMFMGQITVRTEDTIRQQDHRRERAALATLLWHSADRPLPRSALHQGALLQRSARRYC